MLDTFKSSILALSSSSSSSWASNSNSILGGSIFQLIARSIVDIISPIPLPLAFCAWTVVSAPVPSGPADMGQNSRTSTPKAKATMLTYSSVASDSLKASGKLENEISSALACAAGSRLKNDITLVHNSWPNRRRSLA